MRIAVLSDVHSNIEALDAVLERARGEDAGATYVLGDIVGYGADPDAVIQRVGALPNVLLLAGNHDLAVTGRFDLTWFNSAAAEAIRWTADAMAQSSRRALEGLQPRGDADGALLVHGSVVDPAAEYVTSVRAAADSFAAQPFSLCFFGHTHLPTVFRSEGSGKVGGAVLADGDLVELPRGERWMLNPGSVGQPRDGDPRASFMIYDTDERTAIVLRVPYEIERAQAKIRAAGLPRALADRLAEGR